MKCPRRIEGPFKLPNEDSWRKDDTCSYCGSLNPDTLMLRLESGDVELTPTDKSYKVYVDNLGGDKFWQSYRKDCDCNFPIGLSVEQIREKVAACPHWFMEEREHTKFYFYHLSEEQQKRFIEIYNAAKMKLKTPGHFYALPFFCSRDSVETKEA